MCRVGNGAAGAKDCAELSRGVLTAPLPVVATVGGNVRSPRLKLTPPSATQGILEKLLGGPETVSMVPGPPPTGPWAPTSTKTLFFPSFSFREQKVEIPILILFSEVVPCLANSSAASFPTCPTCALIHTRAVCLVRSASLFSAGIGRRRIF